MSFRPTFINFNDANLSHDRVIIVGQKKFYVQSQCLSMWSDSFDALFNKGLKESFMDILPIADVKPEDFTDFLLTIYPTRKPITAQNIGAMIKLSFRFMSSGLLDMCRDLLNNEFEKLDMLDLLEVGLRYDFDNLKERVAAYIKAELEIGSVISKCSTCQTTTSVMIWSSTSKTVNDSGSCVACGGKSVVTKLTKFIQLDNCEYLKKNFQKIQELSPDCQAFLFKTLFAP